MRLGFGVALVVLGLTGCTTSIYSWKSYEESIYRQYHGTDFELAKEISLLEKEVRETEANGRRVPPGEYAHLAYLYHEAGDRPAAVRLLEAERQAFPESAVFVTRLLEGMQ